MAACDGAFLRHRLIRHRPGPTTMTRLCGIKIRVRSAMLSHPEAVAALGDTRVPVPQCSTCARGGPPEPSHVHYQRQAMTFVVRPVADRIRR
jgi:hypothetical protein